MRIDRCQLLFSLVGLVLCCVLGTKILNLATPAVVHVVEVTPLHLRQERLGGGGGIGADVARSGATLGPRRRLVDSSRVSCREKMTYCCCVVANPGCTLDWCWWSFGSFVGQ